jgi:hypothetical protein
LSYSAVGPVLTRNTTKRLGIRIAPHDARDAAATTWAIAAPEQIGIARDLLAHSDLRTTIKHYNRAKGIEASRAHNQLIARLRRKPSRRDRAIAAQLNRPSLRWPAGAHRWPLVSFTLPSPNRQ